MNCSKPGGGWNCGWSSSLSVLCRPDLMKTTLGFTASATEAKASLRLCRLATPTGSGAAVLVAPAA
jgi:hypothetical protein